jgi:hypothetical protein
MVQIDGPKQHVYINFRDNGRMQDILPSTGGQFEYRHTSGEISTVRINTDGMGARKVRTANLLPEVSDGVLRTVLSRYGDVRDIQAATRSSQYRYPVTSGIRLAMIILATHIPSHITVAVHRVLMPYDAQPMACYGCNATDHLNQACPTRRRLKETAHISTITSSADIAARGMGNTLQPLRTKRG